MSVFRVIVSIMLLITSAGVGVILLWPAYQEYSQLRVQVKDVQERLERGETVLKQLEDVRNQVVLHQGDFDKISFAIPQETELPAVYDLLQDLSSSSGLFVQSIDARLFNEDEEAKRRVAITELSLKLSGSYESLKFFLSSLRKSARILNVRSVKVSENLSEALANTLDIQIDMNVYSYEKELQTP